MPETEKSFGSDSHTPPAGTPCLQTEFEETTNSLDRTLGKKSYTINFLVVVMYKMNLIHFVMKAWPSFIGIYDCPPNLYLPKCNIQFYCVVLLTFNHAGVSNF